MERKVPVGLVRNFKTESAAWAEVERQRLSEFINQPTAQERVTFAAIAQCVSAELAAGRSKVMPNDRL